MPKPKLISVIFLISLIFIDFLGVSMVVVLFPTLFFSQENLISSACSHRFIILGCLLAIYPLGQILGASFFGKLSDYFGRRKILLITLTGTCIGFLLSGYAIAIHSIILLFLSRILAGFSAGNVAIAQASLMDISQEDNKLTYIGYGQMAMGLAYVVGPLLGALLSDSTLSSSFSLSMPFWFFSGVLILLLFYTVTGFQETLTQYKSLSLYKIFSFSNPSVGSVELRASYLVWLIFVSGWWLFESFMPAFLLQKFNFDTVHISQVLAFNGALYALFQYAVIQKLAKKMRPDKMMRMGCLIAGLAIISIAYAANPLSLYLSMTVFVLSMGFAIPGIITHIANQAEKKDQGHVMGVVNAIQAIATVIVMVIGGCLDSVNNSISIISGGCLVVLSWLLFIGFMAKNNSAPKLILHGIKS